MLTSNDALLEERTLTPCEPPQSPDVPDPQPARESEDRRRRPTPMFSRYTFRGRRRSIRRADDSSGGYYVDRQSTFEVVAVLSLLVLTVTDGLATLHIIAKGGTELNPIMASTLELGDTYFLATKLSFSIIGGVLILIHTRFPGVRKALYALLTLYGVVVVYHAVLISRFTS